jgi:uncharacterized protein (TIGR02996 family)
MTDDQAFLQAIRANFADDAVRLVYADWLEERGDPRAEFIRVECALAHMARDDPRRRALWRRDLEMIVRYKDRWFPMRAKYRSWDCRRGFIDEISTETSSFLPHAAALFCEHPVRYLYLSVNPGDAAGVASCPELALVEILQITGHSLGNNEVAELANSPHLVRLRDLSLTTNWVGPEGAQALAAGPALAGLNRLNLAGNRVGLDGLRALLASSSLRQLRDLDLSGGTNQQGRPVPNIGNDGVLMLASSPETARLTRLNLSSNAIAASGLRALADSPHLEGLSQLIIHEPVIPEREAEALRARFGDRVQISGRGRRV